MGSALREVAVVVEASALRVAAAVVEASALRVAAAVVVEGAGTLPVEATAASKGLRRVVVSSHRPGPFQRGPGHFFAVADKFTY